MLTANLEAQTAKLVEQLAAPEFSVREAAQRQLIAAANLAELKQFLEHDDIEVRNRIEHIVYYLTKVDYDVDKLPKIWSLSASDRWDYEWSEPYQTYDNDLATQMYEELYRINRLEEDDSTITFLPMAYKLATDPSLFIGYYDSDLAREAMLNYLHLRKWRGASEQELEDIIARAKLNEKEGHHIIYTNNPFSSDRALPPSVVMDKKIKESEW